MSDQTIDHAGDSTILGDYEILREIAHGGMGVVYEARQKSLDRIVALKLILGGTVADEAEISRFKAEARAAARLDHPHIVPVYDFGMRDGQHFFTMGFVDGPSLAARVKSHGPMEPRTAAEMMAKVARAVAYAHAEGVVHRDLKPGNVLIDSAGEPRVTDFGLAKRIDDSMGLTATGQVLGTPAYMPPEQAAGDAARIGPLADVYSLGATLVAILTGSPPFQADSIPELLMKVAEEPARPPSASNAKVPKDLDAICLRCLAKAPEDRYPTADAVAEDLERFVRGDQIGLAPRRRRGPWALSLACFATLAVISAGVWFWLLPGREEGNQVVDAKKKEQPIELPIVVDFLEADRAATDRPGPRPWDYRHADAAKAFEAAFRKHGLEPLDTDAETFAAKAKSQPPEVRQAIVWALERWEIHSIHAKAPGADLLRAAQDAIDPTAWRRQMRLLRSDNNGPGMILVAAEVVKEPIPFHQAENLGLALQLGSAWGKPQAMPVLRKLRESHTNSFWVNTSLASVLIAVKSDSRPANLTEAAQCLEAASSARPESPIPHLQMAVVFAELKNDARAKAEAERAQEKQYPEAAKALKEAWRLLEAKDFKQAASAAEEAVAASPEWNETHATLGIARRRAGEAEAAEAAFRKAVEMASSEAAAIELLRNVFTRDAGQQPPRNRLKEQFFLDRIEAEVLRRVVKVRPNPSLDTLNTLWRHLRGIDQIDDNLATAKDMLAYAKTPAWQKFALHSYVSRAAASGRPLRLDDPLVEQFKKSDPFAFDHLGLIAVRSGQLDVAVDTCLAAYAESKDEWWDKPRALALARQWASGESFEKKLRKLQADDPSDLRPAVMLALNDTLADRKKEAALALGRARARFNAPHVLATVPLAADFLLVGRLDDAVRVAQLYEFARTFDPNRGKFDRWGLPSLAFAFLRAGDVLAAESHAQAAYQNAFEFLLSAPKGPLNTWEIHYHTYAASALGRVRFRQGRYREAAEILSDAYNIDPFLVHFDYYPHDQLDPGADYAATLLATGDLAEAGKVARQIVGFRPEKATARQALGQVLLAEGKPTEAAAEFRLAAKLDPFDGHAHFYLGRALLATDDLDGAVKAFEQSIRSYHRRWMRDFAPIPEDAAVAVLSALRKKPLDALPPEQRKSYQAKAIGWIKSDLAAWRKKAEGDVPFEYASAASVLHRLVEAKIAQDRSLVDALPDDLKGEWRGVWKDAETFRQIAVAKREKLPQDPAEWLWPASREREVAEWVIKQGGMVTVVCPTVQGRAHRLDWLPNVPFRVEGVSFSDLPVDDSAIDKLADLLMLTEVHLDGTKVTDAGIRKLVDVAPLLSRLNIERTKVGDDGLAAVAHLTEVYARRSAVTSGAVAAANNDRFGPKVLHESTLAKSNGKKSAGHALRFDGMTAHAELPISYTSGQPITIEATILLEPGMCNRYARVVECEQDHKSGIATFLHPRRESWAGVIVKGGFRWTSNPSSSIPLLERTPIALSFDGTTLRSFVNGRMVGDTKQPELQRGIKLDRFFLAKQGTHASDHFRGIIDEVRISSTCRYVKDYTPSPKLEADASTEGLYHMDEGSGETLRDSSGKGRDGRIFNAKWVREEEE